MIIQNTEFRIKNAEWQWNEDKHGFGGLSRIQKTEYRMKWNADCHGLTRIWLIDTDYGFPIKTFGNDKKGKQRRTGNEKKEK